MNAEQVVENGAGARLPRRLELLERVAACARDHVVSVFLTSRPPRADLGSRFLSRLVGALAELEEIEPEPEPVFIGATNPRYGHLHITRDGRRTRCDLPLVPYWKVADPKGRRVCDDCEAAEADGGA